MEIESTVRPSWVQSFPELLAIPDAAWHRAERGARIVTLPAGLLNTETSGLVLVLDGEVQVRIVSSSGGEIMLRRVTPGEICWFNLAELFYSVAPFPNVELTAQSGTRIATIYPARIREAVDESPRFRALALATLAHGIHEMLGMVETLRFGQMNQRVAQWLLANSGSGSDIRVTHSGVANELGTAREVVSRLLKDFERSGLVRLQRGRIAITDRTGLGTLIHRGN